MPSNYTGNPSAIESPAVAPAPATAPLLALPIDTDQRNSASIYQPFKVLADYVTYLINRVFGNATQPSTSSNAPQVYWADAAGNGRYVIDHNGLPTGGRISQIIDPWLFAPGASQSPWSALVGSGSIGIVGPTSSFNGRYLTITPSSSGYSLLYTQPLVICNFFSMSAVLEFEVGFNADAAGSASGVQFCFGLGSGTDPLVSDPNIVLLYKKNNQTQYWTATNNGVSSIAAPLTVATAAPSAGYPTDRVRIEIQGSSSAYGAYQARFFINEVLVQTVTSGSLPGSTGMRLVFGSYTGGAIAGSPLAYVGPISLTWNRQQYAPGSPPI